MAVSSPEQLKDPSSFRDPSGYIFSKNGELFRQVNQQYVSTYKLVEESGFFEELFTAKLLVKHVVQETSEGGLVLKPEKIPFISYPFEWSFSQLKDAALLTLEIEKRALTKGLFLKDASAYNVQFVGSRPVFIDTLSFEEYQDGSPWVAYRQFCQHFLAPLALMAEVDVSLVRMMELHIDGIPLPLAAKLLPRKSRFNLGLLTHIFLHAGSQVKHGSRTTDQKTGRMTKMARLGLLDSLETTVRNLKLKNQATEWEHYYDFTNYTDRASVSKREIITSYIEKVKPKTVWDLGANQGLYSRLASKQGIFTIASDIDPMAVEQSYLASKKLKEDNLLSLVLDMTNPSPGIGWANRERQAFFKRGKPDLIMALALIHHLVISNNMPLAQVAEFLAAHSNYLLIEFVPKEDSQVQKLLATREDIFPTYTQKGFEQAFRSYFTILSKEAVLDSDRTLYLMRV